MSPDDVMTVLSELLGAHALAWLCGVDLEQTLRDPPEAPELWDAAGPLAALMLDAVRLGTAEHAASLLRQRLLRRVDPPFVSDATRLREAAGAEPLVSYAVADPVVAALWAEAREAYVAVLWTHEASALPYRLELLRHLLQTDDVLDALEHDERLSGALHGEGLERCAGPCWETTGGGGSLQAVMLPEHLLNFAIADVRLRPMAERTPECLLAACNRAVTVLRRQVGMGRSAQLTVRTGLTGITVTRPVELPWGRIQPSGDAVWPGANESTAELLSEEDHKLVPMSPQGPPDAAFVAELQGREASIRARELNTALAVLLALRKAQLPVVKVAWRSVASLWNGPTARWPNAERFPAAALNVDEHSEEIAAWAVRLAELPRHSHVARSRLVSAVGRQDPSDGFIDAVVVLDNLFGSKEGDSTLRIAGSIAKLLHPPGEARTGCYGRIRDWYGDRSDLVHGGVESLENAAEQRDAVSRIALELLAALLIGPPELLRAPGTQRSQSVLLDDMALPAGSERDLTA